jgi:protein PhnA
MADLPPCPACASTLSYQAAAPGGDADADALFARDSVGNMLADGDTVTVIQDLKVKGSSTVVKVGTKVKGIRLVAGDHDIDCRVDGIGPMGLTSEFVKEGVRAGLRRSHVFQAHFRADGLLRAQIRRFRRGLPDAAIQTDRWLVETAGGPADPKGRSR